MKLHSLGIALAVSVVSLAAGAAPTSDLSRAVDPGEWTYTVHAMMQLGKTDIPAKTITNKKCITQQDLNKSKDWLTNSRDRQCKMQDMRYAGHVLTFTQQCRMGGGELTVKGKMTIDSRTAYHGVFDTTGNIAGQAVVGHTTISAQRTGDCAPQTSGP